jgi:hypothetical protein
MSRVTRTTSNVINPPPSTIVGQPPMPTDLLLSLETALNVVQKENQQLKQALSQQQVEDFGQTEITLSGQVSQGQEEKIEVEMFKGDNVNYRDFRLHLLCRFNQAPITYKKDSSKIR